MATSQHQDALEKAKERLKSNYSKARSARHGAQLCQPTALGSFRRPGARPAPPPRPRAAPPRAPPIDLTGEAPTLSPALKAQGWAVKQSRSTGGYYYVHTANGREWSQWEPPVAPERRSSPERAAAALFSDEDDDGSASDSEDEMPVSALLARQATANDEAIAQALAGSPPKRSRRITGGVGGRRHGKKRREPVVQVPAAADDGDDSSSVWSQSSLSDSNPPSPTYESVMESGGIDYESGFLDDENPAPAGRGRGAIKPAWMTRGGALVDDDFRPLGSRAVLAAAPAPRPPPQPRAAVSTPRPWRNPYAAEAAATNAAPAPRGWRNPYAAEAAATHVITPEGAPFGQAPRWAPPTPWGPPVLPVQTQSEPWTSPQQCDDADFDGAEFSGDEGETPSVRAGRAAERRRAGTIEPRIPPRAPWPPASGDGKTSHGRQRARRVTAAEVDAPALANALRGWLAAKGGGIYAWQLPDFYKSPACTGLEVPTRKSVKLLRTVENSGLRFTYMPHHNTGSEGTWWIALDHGAPAFAPPAEPKRSPRGAARGSRSPERDEPAPPSRSAPAFAPPGSEPAAPAFAPPGSEPAPAPTDIHGLPDAITRLDEDVLAYLFQNDALYDSLFVEGRLDEDRLRDAVATFEASVRGAATYQKPEATEEAPPLTADGAVDALYDIIVSQGVDCIDASRLTLDFSAFGGVKALVRAHGGEKLRWVDVGQRGRVVVVGAGRRSCEAVAPPPTPSFLNRPAAVVAPDLAPSSTGFSAEAASTPKAIPAPPDEKPRHCRICGEAFSVGWSATESLWVLEGCVASSVDDGTTALVHADCRASAAALGDVIEAAALIPDPSAPRTVSPRAVSPPPPSAVRTINDATVAARTKQILAEDESIKAQYGAGSLTVRTLRAAVAKALGVEEAAVKKVVKQTLMAQIAADNKTADDDVAVASAPAPAAADADDDWGSATFGMSAAAAPAPAVPAQARKSRFDVPPKTAPAPAAIADVAAPEPDFGARLAARAERFGAKAPTDQRDRSRRRDRSRSRSRERSRRRDKKRKGGDVYVPPPRRQERR
ncbi:unnamed protein product [Pelagomonas calceolata]|uniref:WW domain-containing protein n=2 Tax=Pelagomonas calceolata TaxID=35677 RepID=A0A8J2SFY2_9STRA|nr:unnamed protein product [Pelagomonas calceolata]